MYRAIKKIGDYQVGDVVPDRQAELWLEMYVEPHVEKIGKESIPEKKLYTEEESKKIPSEERSSVDEILEDYLGRNQSVVRKNLLEDNLGKDQLKKLLKIEKSDKRRPLIINTIKQKLEIN